MLPFPVTREKKNCDIAGFKYILLLGYCTHNLEEVNSAEGRENEKAGEGGGADI